MAVVRILVLVLVVTAAAVQDQLVQRPQAQQTQAAVLVDLQIMQASQVVQA